MRNKLVVFVLSALLSAGAIAQAVVDGEAARQRLVEQKLRLVATLLNAPAAKSAAARGGEAQALLDASVKALGDARAALAGGNTETAAKLADDAFKSLAAVSRRMSADSTLSESAQRKNYDDLREQVATYRASVAELVRDPKTGAAAQKLLGQIDKAVADAARLSGGQLGEANKKLAETYKLAVSELSRIRAGQEVVMSLKFDSPADEYAYEQKRFKSNEIMVNMLIAEGKAEGERKTLVEGFVGEGRRLMQQAAQDAEGGRYKEAVVLMEQATAQTARALQAMGVPVF